MLLAARITIDPWRFRRCEFDASQASTKETFELVGPAVAGWQMLSAPFLQRFFKLLEQFALVLGEFHRGLNGNVAIQITRVARTHAFDAFSAQPELLAGLCALGNVDGRFATERGHINFAAQCGLGEADRHRAVQVVAIALKNVVLFQTDLYVQIARWTAVGAGLAVAGAANAHGVVDAGWNFDFQRFLFFELALAMASAAGVRNDLARATALRAGLLHTEKALANLHLALTLAGCAGLGTGARFGAGAAAGVTRFPSGDANLCVFAVGRFFQCDFHGIAEVVATEDLSAPTGPTSTPAKDVAEDVAKPLAEAPKTLSAATPIWFHPGMALLVEGGPPLRAVHHLVGPFGLF